MKDLAGAGLGQCYNPESTAAIVASSLAPVGISIFYDPTPLHGTGELKDGGRGSVPDDGRKE